MNAPAPAHAPSSAGGGRRWLPPSRRRLPKVLEPEDYRRIYAALPEADRPLWHTLYATGCRLAELLGQSARLTLIRTRECPDGTYYQQTARPPATFADLDHNRRTLRVRGKGNKERLIPLPAGLWRELERAWGATMRRPDAPLFAGQTARGFRRRLAAAAARAGTIHAHPHMARHSLATRLLRATQNLHLVASHLGHAHVQTTTVYAHLDVEEARRAVEGLDG